MLRANARSPRIYPLRSCLAVCLLALSAQFAPVAAGERVLANKCPGGRFVVSVETVQRHNWIDNAPTIYDRKETLLRAPAWLGKLSIMHASQGFLLSGEERIGRWTTVTVPPSITLQMRLFGRSVYWSMRLPVFKETQACRDEQGDLYVR